MAIETEPRYIRRDMGNGRWETIDVHQEAREAEAKRQAAERALIPPEPRPVIVSYSKEQRKADGQQILSVAGKVIAGALRPTLQGFKDRLDSLDSRVADAERVAVLETKLSALNSKVDKLATQLSATQKHNQSLERKLGELTKQRSIP